MKRKKTTMGRTKTIEVMSRRQARKVFYIPRGLWMPHADPDGDYPVFALKARFPTWEEVKAVWPDSPPNLTLDWGPHGTKERILEQLAYERRCGCWDRLSSLLEELGLGHDDEDHEAHEACRDIDLDSDGRIETAEQLVEAIAKHDLLDVLTTPAARNFALACLKYSAFAGRVVASRL